MSQNATCRGLFITGTDTGVGKTYLSTAIVRRLRELGVHVGAYKPTASGGETGPHGPFWQDVDELSAALGDVVPKERICPQRWMAPVAPPVAARLEGKQVDAALLREGADWWRSRVEFLVVEGAGGLLSPLTETEAVADLARDLGFSLLIVSRLALGTINHTLLTWEAATRRGLEVAGIILNQADQPESDDCSRETNAAELARRLKSPILGVFPYAPAGDLLQNEAFRRIDFVGLATARKQVGVTH